MNCEPTSFKLNLLSHATLLGVSGGGWVQVAARAAVLTGGMASVLLSSNSAMAQQQVANGISLTIPGGSFTTTANSTPAFLAENGGSITATAPVTLLTEGGTSFGVQALTNSTVTLNGGSVTTTGPNFSNILLSDGSTITVTGVDLATTSGGADGAAAQNGGSIFIHGGSIDSNSGGGTASIRATGSSQVTADQGLHITTSAVGAWALSGGSINLDTVSISNSGTLPFVSGIRADAAGSQVTANHVVINLTSDFADGGALANGGGKIVITNGDITTSGAVSPGLHAALIDPSTGTFAEIDATNVNITTSGESGFGVVASGGAIINLNNVNINTSGSTAYGLFVEGSATETEEINGTGVTFHGTGTTGYGAVVVTGGVLHLTDSLLSATGPNGGGVFVSGSGSLATLTDSTVTSAQLDAGVVRASGHFLVTGSSLTGGRYGISSVGGTAADPNIISVSGGSLAAPGGDAFNTVDTITQISLSNGTAVTAGSGNLLTVVSTNPATLISNVTFNVQGITAAGNIIADASSVATVNLTSGTIITGTEQNTFTTIDASSKWVMNGNSDIHSLTLAGQVLYTPPTGAPTLLSSYKTLTTANYVGLGGTLGLNTFLGGDNSPSDRLVISGTASGSSSLHVTNTTGPGALTTGNGILVVDAINSATTAAFTLANPELRGGAYDYRLFHGSVDASGPENWYLRSSFGSGPPVTPPGVLPPTPPTPGPGTFPIIGPEIATFGMAQPMALQAIRATLGTPTDDRLGYLFLSGLPCEPSGETNAPSYTKAPYTKAPIDCGVDGWRPAVWGRVFGQQIDNHYQAFADTRVDGQVAGFQAGFDLLRSDSLIPGHKDYAGLFVGYGNANMDVTGLVTNAAATGYVLQHTGSLNLDAWSGGAYWTHYGIPGWYIDLTLQGTTFGGVASTEFAQLKISGVGFVSSLEGGYPIALPVLGPGFVLEPQAQVLWQWVSFDPSNDGLGPVGLGTSSTTTARLGLKGRWSIVTDSGPLWQPYVRANYWSDFGGNDTTVFGGDIVPLITHAQYMDVDAGFATKINAHLAAFAEAGYQFAVSHEGGGQRNGVKGTAGLRYQW